MGFVCHECEHLGDAIGDGDPGSDVSLRLVEALDVDDLEDHAGVFDAFEVLDDGPDGVLGEVRRGLHGFRGFNYLIT